MRFLVVGTKDVPVVKHFSITRLETQESSRKPLSLKRLTEGLKPTRSSEDNEVYKHPPKEEDPLRVFNKQIDEDRRIVISRSNINELQKLVYTMLLLVLPKIVHYFVTGMSV